MLLIKRLAFDLVLARRYIRRPVGMILHEADRVLNNVGLVGRIWLLLTLFVNEGLLFGH